MESLQALKTNTHNPPAPQKILNMSKVMRKDSTNAFNSCYPSFLFADIDSINLVGAAHTSHQTVSILTLQTSFHTPL